MSAISAIPEPNDKSRAQCLIMFCMGFRYADIERMTGENGNTIRSWAKRDGWTDLKAEFESLKAKQDPFLEQPLVKAISKRAQFKEEFLQKTGAIAAEDAEHWKQLSPEERIEVAPAITSLNKMHRDNLDLSKEESDSTKGNINLTFLTRAHEPGMVRELTASEVREIENTPNAQPTTTESFDEDPA